MELRGHILTIQAMATSRSLERALERRVRVPILADGNVHYVISVPLKPQVFDALLRAQRLPASWEITLLDGNKRLIAALPAPSGEAAEQEPLEARRKAAAGAVMVWLSGRRAG